MTGWSLCFGQHSPTRLSSSTVLATKKNRRATRDRNSPERQNSGRSVSFDDPDFGCWPDLYLRSPIAGIFDCQVFNMAQECLTESLRWIQQLSFCAWVSTTQRPKRPGKRRGGRYATKNSYRGAGRARPAECPGDHFANLVLEQMPNPAPQNTAKKGVDRRQDRRDLRSDRRDLRGDRRDLRNDLRNGDRRDARRDRQDIRSDRHDLRRDRRDLRSDRRDIRHDRRDRRSDRRDIHRDRRRPG